MTFTDWLKFQAKKDHEINGFLRKAIEDQKWPQDATSLKTFIRYLKTKGASVDICGNLLKFWAKYLKVVSSIRPITADEIREIREVLVNMLTWIRSNSKNLTDAEQESLHEAENQVACLEEKEVELRFINLRINHKKG